jgi:preprotein translocase SecE subunit
VATRRTKSSSKTGEAKRSTSAKAASSSVKTAKKPSTKDKRIRSFNPLSLIWKALRVVLVAVAKTLWVILFPLRPLLRPLLRYLVGVRQEFREVVWPKRREAWKLTFAVVAFALVFVLLVQVIDYGVRQVFEKVII